MCITINKYFLLYRSQRIVALKRLRLSVSPLHIISFLTLILGCYLSSYHILPCIPQRFHFFPARSAVKGQVNVISRFKLHVLQQVICHIQYDMLKMNENIIIKTILSP